jgi:MFS family permease
LVTLATSFAKSYPQLLATRAVMGVSEACYIPAALALIADYHRGSTRSLATGIHMSGIYAGMALGGMGGWMAEHHGWSSGFQVFGCVGVAYAVLLLILLRDVPRGPGVEEREAVHPVEAMRALGSTAAFWIIAFHWGFLGFTGWAMVAWMPTFLREHYFLSQTDAGFTATAYMQVAAFGGVLVGGALADRWIRTNLRGRIRVPMIALALASPFVFVATRTDALWFTILCLIVFGFSRGCSDANMMPILCQVAEPRHRATGYGILNFFSCTIGGVAPYLGGWLKERQIDLSLMFAGSAVVVLFCALLLIPVKPARQC